MSACGKCNQVVSRTAANPKLLCQICNSYFHPNCVNINETDLSFLKDKPWSCPNCLNTLRMTRRASDSTPVKVNKPANENVSSSSVNLIEKLMDDFRRDSDTHQNKLVSCLEELKVIVNSGKDKQAEFSNIITKQSEIIERQQALIDSLKKEVESTQRRLQTAEEKIDDMEQYSRRNTLEIDGVPEIENEQIMNTLVEVGETIGLKISQDMVDACHRLKPLKGRPGTRQPPPSIVIRFARRQDADRMMELRKKMGTLKRHQIRGFSGQEPIFINRSLTSGRRKLLCLARQLKRDGRIKDAWVDQSGRVKIRKDVDGKIFVIKSEMDLSFPSL